MEDDDEFDRLYEEELEMMRELHGSPSEIDRRSSTSHATKKSLSFNGMSPDFNVRSINGDRAIVETESPLPAMGQSPAVSRPAVVESAGDGKRGQKSRESHDERYGLLPSDSDDEDGEVLVPSVESCPNAAKRPRIEVTPSNSSHHVCRRIVSEESSPASVNSCPAMAALERVPAVLSRRYLLRRLPVGPHITVTGKSGKRMYLRLKEEHQVVVTGLPSSGRLLPIPVSHLRQKLEDERHRRLIEQSEKLSEELRRTCSDATEDNEIEEAENDAMMSDGKEDVLTSERSLWVDKYSPRHFTELLSDDGTNRVLLSWLKLWDRVVFGETTALVKRALSVKVENEVIDRKSKRSEQKTNSDMQHSNWSADPVKGLDANGRPLQKIALLYGSPGLGKTTLAHVLATHCGYNVVEMNASDDRSPDAFHNWLESATQMQSVLKSDRKPNCLVIDEIDGAPTPTINVLLSLIKKTPSGGGGKGGKRGKRKVSDLLARPVICICNDLYAPSLRQLRPHALVLSFSSTSSARLANRLHQVAQQESMNAEISALMSLCQKADNDIRSCLNTLQFIHGQGGSLNNAIVQDVHVGQKDGHKSLFDLWQDVFRLSKNQRSNKPSLSTIGWSFQSPLERTRQSSRNGNISSTSLQARFSQILSVAQASGEYGKAIQGIFENYLNVRVKDPHLEALGLAQDWFCFADVVQQSLHTSQSFSLQAYMPFIPVVFHLLYAGPAQVKIMYPRSQYEVMLILSRNANVINSMALDMSPSLRRGFNRHVAAMELLPSFVQIMSPNFRPVSVQLFNQQEKCQLRDLVDTMISYNVTYHQDRGADGQYSYVLDPNIELVTSFPDMAQHKQLPYTTKQMIAREIELEKLRRAFPNKMESTTSRQSVQKESKTEKKPFNVTTKLTPRKPKAGIEKLEKDFFGRVIKGKPSGAATVKSHTAHLLWFRFNEGFSNAVRRTVRVQDLL